MKRIKELFGRFLGQPAITAPKPEQPLALVTAGSLDLTYIDSMIATVMTGIERAVHPGRTFIQDRRAGHFLVMGNIDEIVALFATETSAPVGDLLLAQAQDHHAESALFFNAGVGAGALIDRDHDERRVE